MEPCKLKECVLHLHECKLLCTGTIDLIRNTIAIILSDTWRTLSHFCCIRLNDYCNTAPRKNDLHHTKSLDNISHNLLTPHFLHPVPIK